MLAGRHVSRLVHRWTALLLGLHFVLLGLTGAVLVWHHELDAMLNPDLLAVEAGGSVMPLARAEVVARAVAPANARGLFLEPPGLDRTSWSLSYLRSDADGAEKRWTAYLHPSSGALLGRRDWSMHGIDRAALVRTLYDLHAELLIGEGRWIVGTSGLTFLVMLASGLVIWWPRGGKWRVALTLKRRASKPRRIYDFHRVVGIYPWPALFILTLSGLYLTFPTPIHRGLSALLPMAAAAQGASQNGTKNGGRSRPTQAAGDLLSRFPDARLSGLSLPREPSEAIEVYVLRSGTPRARFGTTLAIYDRSAGRLLRLEDARNRLAGDLLLDWQYPLHSGEALGLVGRLLWTLAGLAPAALAFTGLWMWTRRWRAAAATSKITLGSKCMQ